jgi:hypothetical protein
VEHLQAALGMGLTLLPLHHLHSLNFSALIE